MVSSAHNVCPKGYYIAIVSTIAENDANHHIELEPGFERLGAIEEKFMGPAIPLYEPLDDGAKDNIFISKSYDSTSHFETTTGKFSSLNKQIKNKQAPLILREPIANYFIRGRAGYVQACRWRGVGG